MPIRSSAARTRPVSCATRWWVARGGVPRWCTARSAAARPGGVRASRRRGPMQPELWDPEPGFLHTARDGLPPRPAFAAVQAMRDEWRTGRTSWEQWDRAVDESRGLFARLVGAAATDGAGRATRQVGSA